MTIRHGDLYDSNMRTKEIAQKLREFVKDEKAKGNISKELKINMRTELFAGGSAIDATIVGIPQGTELYDPKACTFWLPEKPRKEDFYCTKYSPKIQKTVKSIETLASRYNAYEDDPYLDYPYRKFYFNMAADHALARESQSRIYDDYFSTGQYVEKPKQKIEKKIEPKKSATSESSREADIVRAIDTYGAMVDFSGDKKKCLCKLPERTCENLGQPSLWNKDILKSIGVDKKEQKLLYPTLSSKNLGDIFVTKMSVCLK